MSNLIYKVKPTSNVEYSIVATGGLNYKTGTGTAAKTSSPYCFAKWEVVLDDSITELYDGLAIVYKVPVAANGSYGTAVQVKNSGGTSIGGYHPVVMTTNSILPNRYGVGAILLLVYDSALSCSVYGTNAGANATAKASITGVWVVVNDYDSGNNYERYYDTYFRPYAGSAVYRYKICGLDKDNRIQPIVTTNQESDTQVTKSPNTVAMRASAGLWYYNSTTTVTAGSVMTASVLYNAMPMSTCVYNFNANIPTYSLVYLHGTYDRTTDMFTLKTGTAVKTGYWQVVPTNTANITLSSYFTSGDYYWLVGGTYSSANCLQLFMENPVYYFDGTNLIPVANMPGAVASHNHAITYTSTNSGTSTATITTASHSHTFTGTAHTHSITMKTTTDNTGNTQPTFSGTTVSITFSGTSANTSTPSSNVTGAPSKDYTGAPSKDYTGAASTSNSGNAQPTFTGTTVNITYSNEAHNHSVVPAGTITGTYSNKVLTLSFTGSTVTTSNSNVTGSIAVVDSATGNYQPKGTVANHSHTITHTHSLSAHTHSLSSHTHSLSNHTHSVTATGSIAVANNAQGNYKPAGTVSNHSHTYYQPSQAASTTAGGTLSQVTVTGTASHSHTYDKANSPTSNN